MCFGVPKSASSSWQTLECLNISLIVNYRAPGLWHVSEKDLSKWLGPAVDVWSYGCVLYEVAVGKVLMRPMRSYIRQSCHATIKEWCQHWQALQKILPGAAKSILKNPQESRNSHFALVSRVLLLDPSLKSTVQADSQPKSCSAKLRSWGRH